jgi:hypothetical protein
VKFIEGDRRPDVKSRHSLVKFRTMNAPRRFIHEKETFASSLCQKLSQLGVGPNHIRNVMADYYEKKRYVGMVREWIEGKPLQIILTKEEAVDHLESVFKSIGSTIARFHLLIQNPEIQSDILSRHFPGSEATSVLKTRMEEWVNFVIRATRNGCRTRLNRTAQVGGSNFSALHRRPES